MIINGRRWTSKRDKGKATKVKKEGAIHTHTRAVMEREKEREKEIRDRGRVSEREGELEREKKRKKGRERRKCDNKDTSFFTQTRRRLYANTPSLFPGHDSARVHLTHQNTSHSPTPPNTHNTLVILRDVQFPSPPPSPPRPPPSPLSPHTKPLNLNKYPRT